MPLWNIKDDQYEFIRVCIWRYATTTKEKWLGMNKKLIIAAGLIALMAFTTVITFKSLENLDKLDLNDPFEVDIDDN